MTAEVGILNKNGVVLAADSAVTVSGSGEEKVFNYAHKIFSLYPPHDIGIMIYGNANICGVPWEIIISEYRRSIEDPFNRVQDYVSDFLGFLSSIEELKENEGERFLVIRYVSDLLHRIYTEIELLHNNNENFCVEEEFISLIDQMKSNFAKAKPYTKKENLKEFTDHFGEEIAEMYDNFCDELIISEEIKNKKRKPFISIVRNALFSKEYFTDETTGVVITGYGSDDFFPGLYNFSIEGFFRGKLKVRFNRRFKISAYGTTSAIAPFAQQEMVHTIMRGIDPKLYDDINLIVSIGLDSYSTLLEEQGLISKHSDAEKEKLKDENLAATKQTIQKKIKDEYINPILHAIDLMPKEELAVIAETLVNITSFKRKISMEMETVGGPVDVLLITKSEGPIWIKRKHYFDPIINPNYHKRKE